MATNGTLVRQSFRLTALNHCMHTLDFESNMGGIPPDYTSSHWCAKRKSAKKRKKEKELLNNAKILDPKPILIYILVCKYVCMCMYVCLGITAKHLDKKAEFGMCSPRTRVSIIKHIWAW